MPCKAHDDIFSFFVVNSTANSSTLADNLNLMVSTTIGTFFLETGFVSVRSYITKRIKLSFYARSACAQWQTFMFCTFPAHLPALKKKKLTNLDLID